MLEQNQIILKEVNVDKWHAAGYTGKGVNVLVLDLNGNLLEEMEKYATVIDPEGDMTDKATHNMYVTQVVHEFAPDAHIYVAPWAHASGAITEWILANKEKIDVINVSLSSPPSDNYDFFKDLDIPIVKSAGNNGDKDNGITFPGYLPFFICVGAYNWRDLGVDANEITGYSSGGKELDCSAPTDVHTLTKLGNVYNFGGTSCAAPSLTGMLACYIQYRKEAGLPRLGIDEALAFVKANCVDIEDIGFDYASGNGLFKLPAEVPVIVVEPEPTPEPPPTNPGPTTGLSGNTHTVVGGETLWRISRIVGVTVDQLKVWNHLTSNAISVGQVLFVSKPIKTYTVVAEDTLWGISRKFNVTVDQLKLWNKLPSNIIAVGQVLYAESPL